MFTNGYVIILGKIASAVFVTAVLEVEHVELGFYELTLLTAAEMAPSGMALKVGSSWLACVVSFVLVPARFLLLNFAKSPTHPPLSSSSNTSYNRAFLHSGSSNRLAQCVFASA